MTLTTRMPTGKPSWPIMLLAGMEKTGKSYAAAAASTSDLIGRTFWIGIGEDDPDEYGAIPGARFEIVEHDGTYRGILNAADACVAELRVDGKPNLIVVDSMTRLWTMLGNQQQIIANDRARRKAERDRKPVSDEDASIGRDQWNTATDRWDHIIDCLRAHNGPAIVTALLEQVSGTDAKGQPTLEKLWKVQAQKRLPADVGVVVEMVARNEVYLTGVRSLKWQSETGREKWDGDFSVDKLWRDIGLAEKDATTARVHSTVDALDRPAIAAEQARQELLAACTEHKWDPKVVAARYLDASEGVALKDASSAPAIRAFMKLLLAEVKVPA